MTRPNPGPPSAGDPDGTGDDRPVAGGRHTVAPWLALLAVALISLVLRPGASSVGPVLEELRDSLAMGGLAAGLVTALPGLCFGVFGGLAVALSRRVGLNTGIVLGLVATSAGLLLRVTTGSTVPFLLLTALALSGMAIGNVLVPAWIKRTSRDGGVRLMTVYSAGLTAGGALAALLAAPVSEVAPHGWRDSLGLWGVVTLVALVPWLLSGYEEHRSPGRGRETTSTPKLRLTSSPTAVALTVLFGIQSMNAYVQFGWLPQIYRDAGLPASTAGAYMALLTALGIIGGLLMPTVISRARTLAPWMVAFGLFMVAGYLGLLLAPATVPWLWATLLGLSGFAFPTAIALIVARTRDHAVTAQLSGFVQPVGYILAAAGPLLVGVLYAATGGWTLVLVLLMASGAALTLAGLRVSRPVLVDDELTA